jgi:hypothetical protein
MGYIFESEIESIINSVRARTIGESESITLGDLLTSSVHPGIKSYFRAEVEKLLKSEREKEIRSKRFRYSLPEVLRLQEQMDLLLQHRYEFDQTEFDALLDEAVHFQFNYLCRPQFTLMNFLFENRRRISTADIERKLLYCVDYSYYREIIRRYIVDNGLAKITYEEFQSLLEKIDVEIVGRHSSWELARMLKVLFAFVDAGLPALRTSQGEPKLPINAAIVFFEDKKMISMKERLERERDQQELREITLPELANLIEKVRTSNDEAVAAVEEKPARKSGRTKKKPAPEPAPVHVPKPVTLRPVEADQELFRPVATNEGVREGLTLLPSRELTHELFEKKPEVPEVGIHRSFSEAEQKQFAKDIFANDEIAFREALDMLNIISSWEEASVYLDQLFIRNDVDPFSGEAIKFTDKVHLWFHPDSRNAG